MKTEDIFTFGKHKSLTLIDAYTGFLNNPLKSSSIIKIYLQDLFDFFTNTATELKSVQMLNIDLKELAKQHTNVMKERAKKSKIRFNVTQKYIIIENCPDHLLNDFMTFLKAIMQSDFKVTSYNKSFGIWNGKQDVENYANITADSSIEFLTMNGNPSYVEWCIENIDDFFVDSIDFKTLNKTESLFFDNFIIEEISEDILMYKPKIHKHQYTFDESISSINMKKESAFCRNSGKHIRNNINRKSYGIYEETYAQNNEDSGDDFINDVLDGDPDNYWNID